MLKVERKGGETELVPINTDLFDREGRFLYSLETDNLSSPFGTIEAVGPDGEIYTLMRSERRRL